MTDSLFDIVGPVMVGPSSSHTAGAVRLGNLARMIIEDTGEAVQSVEFVLYNSFAKTGKGHGTDKGVLAGFMGFTVSDDRIRDALNEAQKAKLDYKITLYKKANNHQPNTVKFNVVLKSGKKLEIIGHSIGGGKVYLSRVNEHNLTLRGEMPTLILFYKDQPGMIWRVTKILAEKHINIADLICKRRQRDIEAFMTITMDTLPDKDDIAQIRQIPDIYHVACIDKLPE